MDNADGPCADSAPIQILEFCLYFSFVFHRTYSCSNGRDWTAHLTLHGLSSLPGMNREMCMTEID